MLKRSALSLAVVLLILCGYTAFLGSGEVCADQSSLRKPPMVLRHNVLFKFKEDTAAADIRKIEQAFCALPAKIGAIYDFEWGTDVGVEGLSKGFTHCFFVTFENEDGRAEYLPHPAHKAFGALLGPHLEEVIVIDYWTKP